jgi:hypothetical protein
MENQGKPLIGYVIAVVIVWILILCATWFLGGPAKFKAMAIFSLGFMAGMLAMYIAVHVYSWK